VYLLSELTACTCWIGALAMIEADREVNESLQDEAPRPNLFSSKYFVAPEKFAIVE
jgi:hypothetical protein